MLEPYKFCFQCLILLLQLSNRGISLAKGLVEFLNFRFQSSFTFDNASMHCTPVVSLVTEFNLLNVLNIDKSSGHGLIIPIETNRVQ